MTPELTAALVALKLAPPPDGFYDDELLGRRFHIVHGKVAFYRAKEEIDSRNTTAWNVDGASVHWKPWGRYRMLP